MEVKFRHHNIVLDTSEVLDWRLRQSGIHWGFWRWLAPFLSVPGFSVVLIELSLWWQRRREDR
jgi:hypothetical protein